MATNKQKWVRDNQGDSRPLRLKLEVAAGSTRVIKIGEICKVTAGVLIPATSGDTDGLVVADQEQKAADVARMIYAIVPRPGDVFEFPLAAARAVEVGDPLNISDSETLAYTAAGTNKIGRVVGDENVPEPEEKSTTRRSLLNVRMSFDEQASYYAQLTGNS